MPISTSFVNPPRAYTLIPFWFWNDELTEAELQRQIDDFETHGVYGFIPHLRMGLSESVAFMSETYFRFLRFAVDYASKKDMTVVLYDEAMYPSGSCAGQVVAANPRHAARCLERRPHGALSENEELVAQDSAWMYVHCRSMGTIRGVHYGEDDGQPKAPAAGDILNPEAVASFLHLTHDRHYDELKQHFGKTIPAIFTDEPSALGRGGRKDVLPWTWGMAEFLKENLEYDITEHIAALFDKSDPIRDRCMRDFWRGVDARLQAAYYVPYSAWCEVHGVYLTGHPSAPDEIGALRHFQWPGQDIVWRYIEPFKPSALEGDQSTTAKCSSSAQRHYGRSRNANEYLGAYGWELSYAEMLWLTNWLLVRGVNLLYPHAFYYSVRDERRNERPPDVGPNNVWWGEYKGFADYCRRLCWLLSEGKHVCSHAILGFSNDLPWRAAKHLFENQLDFNYIDRDTLLDRCRIADDGIRILDQHYQSLIVDGIQYVDKQVMERLSPVLKSNRVVAFGETIPGIEKHAANGADLARLLHELAPPDVTLHPANTDLRYIHMRHPDADYYLFCNEGKDTIEGTVTVAVAGASEWWNPEGAKILEDALPNTLLLAPLKTRVLCVRRASTSP